MGITSVGGINRVKASLRSRFEAIRRRYHIQVTKAGHRCAILLRWPWPFRKPWQRRRLIIAAGGGGIGDELMCLPVLQEIKRRNPACHITFFTRYPSLFEGAPWINELKVYSPGEKPRALRLIYHYLLPPPRPLITLMAECVGLSMEEACVEKPELHVPMEMERELQTIPLLRVVIQPQASRWTPNKKWPTENWVELIQMLTVKFNVIEIGTDSELPAGTLGPKFHSFVGKTDIQKLAYLISQADFFIGPPSAGMHLAHVLGVPSAILFGGYESPAGHNYPKMIPFYTAVPCAPCWLDTNCPYERKCLSAIKPGAVFNEVCRVLGQETALNNEPR